MALFPDEAPAPAPRRRARLVGWILLAAAVIGGFVFAGLPAPYVIEQPGPVFNTLGSVENGKQTVPLIEIPAEKTYPTKGALDMLTVDQVGTPDSSASWFQIAEAAFDPSMEVLPLDAVYPPGITVQESNKQSEVDMQNSQKDAIAAALLHLGYPIESSLTVAGFSPGSPSASVLKQGDTIVSVNGTATDSVVGLRALIAKTGAGVPVDVVIERDGVQQTLQITPQLSTDKPPVPIIGIYPAVSYGFPFEVKIQLENVGGPSAGQMFALGIIDKLTPGYLNGGAKVAGTGTIDASGTVGAIGGIRQKMYGARAAGATWFLAPYSNCDEVTGHIPSGLHVLAVKTLTDSLAALDAIKNGSSTRGLLSCPSK